MLANQAHQRMHAGAIIRPHTHAFYRVRSLARCRAQLPERGAHHHHQQQQHPQQPLQQQPRVQQAAGSDDWDTDSLLKLLRERSAQAQAGELTGMISTSPTC